MASRITDDKCASFTRLARADINGNDVLDPGEVWRFSCATTLEQADGFPSNGSVSALVTNTATATGTPLLERNPGE